MADDLKGGEAPTISANNEKKDDKAPLVTSIPTIEFVEDVDAFMNLPENACNSQNVLKKNGGFVF